TAPTAADARTDRIRNRRMGPPWRMGMDGAHYARGGGRANAAGGSARVLGGGADGDRGAGRDRRQVVVRVAVDQLVERIDAGLLRLLAHHDGEGLVGAFDVVLLERQELSLRRALGLLVA